MQKMKRIACLVLALCLLAGCTAQPESEPVRSANSQAAFSRPVVSSQVEEPQPQIPDYTQTPEYAAAQPWQRAFFDITMQELAHGAERLELYFLNDGSPMLGLEYADLDNSIDKPFKVWHMVNGTAELLFEVDAAGLVFDRAQQTLGWITTDDYKRENPDPWNESLVKNSVAAAYDGPDVSLRLTVYYYDEAGLPTVYRRLADFFLDTYDPPIPEGAPEWVEEYVKYIYTHLDGAYMQSDPDYWDHGTIRGMVLYDAGQEMPPIMYAWDIPPDGWFGEFYFLGGHGRYSVHNIFGLNGATLYQDEHDNRFLKLESSYLNWYRMGETGWDYLFGEGWISPVLPSDVYINGEKEYFEDGVEAAEWRAPRREQAFAQNGIGNQIIPCEGAQFDLAATPATASDTTEISPWNEVEAKLIEAFCSYAKSIGQWQG